MTDARTKQIQEIEQLLAERRKYEQWLAQLDARKDSTPSHVFVKVHRDYTARLTEAQEKVSSESGAVHTLVTELEQSLAAQERQITDRTDERAEAELRASVGEFAGKEWDKLRVKLDSTIADLSGERDSIQRELDTLRALLTEAEPVNTGEVKRDVDDIAFLRSVLGRSTPYSSTPLPAITDAQANEIRAAESSAAGTSGQMDKRPSGSSATIPDAAAPVEAPNAPPVAAATAVEPEPPLVAARASSVNVSHASSSAPMSASRASSSDMFPSSGISEESSGPRGTDDQKPYRPSGTFGEPPRTTEALKSLKCQECGTLNYPTEWYCERCGGELAAF